MYLIIVIITLISIRLWNKFQCGHCRSNSVMVGCVVIVTGANTGIGYETAKALAKRGARLYLACRNEELGNAAKEKIRSETKNTHVYWLKLDLSSLNSVREFVKSFKKREVKLDVLVNNASAGALGNRWTADGIVQDMQENYFGPFLLTVLLVPSLKNSSAARIVNVSSVAHYLGEVNLNKINKEGAYGDLITYCNSKLCNVLFSNELARKLENSDIVCNSLRPGRIRTGIYRHRGIVVRTVTNFVLATFFKNAIEGAQTSIHLAVSDECGEVTGKYYVDCRQAKPSAKARDRELAAKLWDYSEKLVKLKDSERI